MKNHREGHVTCFDELPIIHIQYFQSICNMTSRFKRGQAMRTAELAKFHYGKMRGRGGNHV